MGGRSRCGPKCDAPCVEDFKKVVKLQQSGLIIYIYARRDKQTGSADGLEETIIVCNTGQRSIKKPEYISELYRYKSKCTQCKTTVRKVSCLLDEFRTIKGNEIIGICEYCKRLCKTKCDRCKYILSKFVDICEKDRKERQERLKVWLNKVKDSLQYILDGEGTCQQEVYKDVELERLLQYLKEPLDVRQPDIDFFPTLEDEVTSLQDLKDSKILLEELLSTMKPKVEEHAVQLSASKDFCICKDVKAKKLGEIISGTAAKPHEGTLPQATILSGEPLKDLDRSLSQEKCRDLLKRLIVLSQDLPRGIHLNKELIQNLLETINIATKLGLSTNIVNKLINQLRELDKSFDYDRSKELDKIVITNLINDLNDLLTTGSSQTINKRLLKLLTLLTNLLTSELGKILQKHKVSSKLDDLNKTFPMVYRDLSRQTREASSHLPRGGSRHKNHDTSVNEIDDALHLLHPSQGKDTMYNAFQGEDIKQERVSRSDSEKKRYEVHSEIDHKITKMETKELKHETYELPTKDVDEGLLIREADKHKSEKKVITERYFYAPGRFKILFGKYKLPPIFGIAEKYSTKTDKEKIQPLSGNETEISKIPDAVRRKSTDKISSLIHVLGDLNRGLAQGVLNKPLLQHLTIDVHDLLGETPMSLLHNIIKELVELCKSVVDGIPNNTNLKLVQELISDASRALGRGLSEDENRRTVNDLLSNLNKTLTPVSKERQSTRKKDTQKGKDLRYLSKAITKRIQDLSKQGLELSQVTLSQPNLSSRNKSKKPEEIQQIHAKTIYSLETAAALEKIKKNKQKEKTTRRESKSVISMPSTQQLRKAKQLSKAILEKILQYEKANEDPIEIEKKAQEARLKEIAIEKGRQTLVRLSSRTNLSVKEATIVTPPSSSTTGTTSVIETIASYERIHKKPKLMIKGERIVPYDAEYIEQFRKGKDQILKVQQVTNLPEGEGDGVAKEDEQNYDASSRDGILRYRLSDRQFIENGWTILPTKKVMRRMNIYRMIPSQPHRDWFTLHRNKKLYYDTGEMLAAVDSDGRGLWFYRSGPVALEYYNARESYVGQRYVIYSSGEEVEHGRVKPRTILALFDIQGNGVVYDHYGNVRLKYNQSEGVLMDPTLGPTCKWKWHTLNDPPMLQQVILNPHLEVRDSRIENVGRTERALDSNPIKKKIDPEMLAIELDNFAREKTSKLLQKFKKLEIRMKAVKLNAQFSLKILDQATIYLFFRDGTTSLKLNLGLLLISDEIIDTDTAEMTDVQTPYDRFPAKSPSVEDIHKFFKTVDIRNQTESY